VNREQEERIVKAFFGGKIQERVLFELSSPKKRLGALSRLCHNHTTTLREKYLIEISKPNSDIEGISIPLRKKGARKYCYIISWNEDIDGQEMPLETALEHVVSLGMPSIVLCIPGKLAYFKSGQGV